MRTTTPEAFDALVADLRAGKREDEVPSHGTLVRVRRSVGLAASRDEVAAQRAKVRDEQAKRGEG